MGWRCVGTHEHTLTACVGHLLYLFSLLKKCHFFLDELLSYKYKTITLVCHLFSPECCWLSWRPTRTLGPSSHRSTTKPSLDTGRSSRSPWTSPPSEKSSPTTSMFVLLSQCCFLRRQLNVFHVDFMCMFYVFHNFPFLFVCCSKLQTFSNNYRYLNLETFIIDVNLVFENCERFNEDDSEIGRAGHSMRRFFDKRWTELLK